MNVPDRTVSREFRDALAGELPGLASNLPHWRMTCHLLFGTLRDVDTGRFALPAELIAPIDDREFDSHYVAYHFLNAYRRDVLDFKISDAVFSCDGAGRVRTVESLILPTSVQALVDAERQNTDKDDRGWMSTGNAWLRKHAVAQRKADRDGPSRNFPKISRPICAFSCTTHNHIINKTPRHCQAGPLRRETLIPFAVGSGDERLRRPTSGVDGPRAST